MKNMGASVRRRLLNEARTTNKQFNDLLQRYCRERFLYRLSKSEHSEKYILKGATVFQVWHGCLHRPTKDVDLLNTIFSKSENVVEIFQDICNIQEDDGLIFKDISTSPLQIGQKYEGDRLKIRAELDGAKIDLQIDIGRMGNRITPEPKIYTISCLLDMPAPKIRTYPPETVIAEKLEAMVTKGLNNSRLKDYYDLLYLARNYRFNGELLTQAIENTFSHRKIPIPKDIPVGLTQKYVDFNSKTENREKIWKRFYLKGTMDRRPTLAQAQAEIAKFIMPIFSATSKDRPFNQQWQNSKWQLENIFDKVTEATPNISLNANTERGLTSSAHRKINGNER